MRLPLVRARNEMDVKRLELVYELVVRRQMMENALDVSFQFRDWEDIRFIEDDIAQLDEQLRTLTGIPRNPQDEPERLPMDEARNLFRPKASDDN